MDITGKNFAITGGASQVGSHIAEILLKEGAARVVLLDNMSLATTNWLEHREDQRLQFVRTDILRLDKMLEHLEGIDGVFHAAGFLTLPLSRDIPQGIDVNVRGTQNVLEASRWCGVKKVVFSSSVAVFGNVNGEVSEDAPFDRSTRGYSSYAAIYGSTKIIGEHLSRIYAENFDMECVSLRYSTVYGDRQHERAVNTLLMTDPIESVRRGDRPTIYGDGSEVHDYVNVLDVASANLAAMRSSVKSGAYTVATGTAVSVNEIVDIVLELFGSDLKPQYVQAKRALTAAAPTDIRFDTSAAKMDLGWQAAISVHEGLRRLKLRLCSEP